MNSGSMCEIYTAIDVRLRQENGGKGNGPGRGRLVPLPPSLVVPTLRMKEKGRNGGAEGGDADGAGDRISGSGPPPPSPPPAAGKSVSVPPARPPPEARKPPSVPPFLRSSRFFPAKLWSASIIRGEGLGDDGRRTRSVRGRRHAKGKKASPSKCGTID